MGRNWLAVASADHVATARRGGFIQVCHGRAAPLRRLQPGDRIVCYSPTQRYSPSHAARDRDRLQAFTALGTVRPGEPYRDEGGLGVLPYRRDVDWHASGAVLLGEVRDRLALVREPNWGYRLRQGLIGLCDADMTAIAGAMVAATARLDLAAA